MRIRTVRDIYKLILSYEKDDSAFRIEGQSTSMQEKMLLQRRMRCYFKICYINIHLCMHHQRIGIFICIWIFIIIHIICL